MKFYCEYEDYKEKGILKNTILTGNVNEVCKQIDAMKKDFCYFVRWDFITQ
jgi:predicted Zn-dependent protease